MNNRGPITIAITPGTIAAIVFILLGFWLAWYLRDLLLLVLTAVVFASAIEPATLRLVKWGFPRVLAVVVLYLVVVGLLRSLLGAQGLRDHPALVHHHQLA
jgi:predicted PurR-regulated permease PerM